MKIAHRWSSSARVGALWLVLGGAVEVAHAQSAFSPIPLEQGTAFLFLVALVPLLVFVFQVIASR